MKSVVSLWFSCLAEAGELHQVRTCRDAAYAAKRIEDEGDSFITIALPAFEKDLLQALSQGRIDSSHFHGFRRSGGLPAFLSGFLRRLFDRSGVVRADASSSCLRSLRQVLLLCSKIEVDTTSNRRVSALRAYVDTDNELTSVEPSLLTEVALATRHLLGSYLAEVESRLYDGDWIPRHSSGSLATRETYNGRYENRTWTERLHEVFPWWEDLAVSPREVLDHSDEFSLLAPEQEPPVRVITVPKTMKGPRVIAMEPAHMQYVQQGIFGVMTDVLHSGKYQRLADIFSWLDQGPNRDLARVGSVDGSYATIDLSEASDRVSLQLVEAMLSSTPFLRKCVLASRSQTALLPDGEVLRLNKFASMGSALCFPMESMVFFIIASLGIADSAGDSPGSLRLRGLPRMRVYGDDLIVPAEAALPLIRRLEAYGLKVNTRKSFTTGLFRESCGSDWFRGDDVSVFKIRHLLPGSRRQPELIESAISFHNRAYEAGWFGTAGFVRDHLHKVMPNIPFAPVGFKHSALWTHDDPTAAGHHRDLQCVIRKSVIFKRIKPVDPLSGYGALKKYYTPHVERHGRHLERDGRDLCVGAYIGWTVDG